MALTALVLFTVFAALGFGWRSWEQRRRTGSTGFHGISGRIGSLEWLAGIGFVAALVIAVAAPVLQLLGAVAPLVDLPWLHAVGVVVAVVGIIATVYAQIDMGESWRIGVDASETTVLVRSGVFAVARNPIFARHAGIRCRRGAGDTEYRRSRRFRGLARQHRDPGACGRGTVSASHPW